MTRLSVCTCAGLVITVSLNHFCHQSDQREFLSAPSCAWPDLAWNGFLGKPTTVHCGAMPQSCEFNCPNQMKLLSVLVQ